MPNLTTIETLGERFAAALAAGDIAALDAMFTRDFEVWYNFSDETLGREQALKFFASYFTAVQVRFRDVRRLPTPDGWVQQHRVDARGADGLRIENLPAIIVFTLRDGKIARIEEYLDSAQTGGFDAGTMTAT